jgi:hypothetical protein
MEDLSETAWDTDDESPRSPFSSSKMSEDNIGKVVFPNFKYF